MIAVAATGEPARSTLVDFLCHSHFSPVCTLPAKGATFYLDRLAFSLFVNRLAEGQISNRDFVRRSHCGRQMGEQLGRGALRYHAQPLLYHKKQHLFQLSSYYPECSHCTI